MSDAINPQHYKHGQVEEWKPVPGYEGAYSVSSLGRIRNDRTGKIKKKCLWGNRYHVTNFYVNGQASKAFHVHRLVATVFLQKPDGCDVVNHKNGDKSDNAATNLEWCKPIDNIIHAYDIGLMNKKLDVDRGNTIRERRVMRRLSALGVSTEIISKSFCVPEEKVYAIVATCSIRPDQPGALPRE